MRLPFARFAREKIAGNGGVAPSSIMVPRVLFLASSLGILIFGLLMIYSSSSIMGLTSSNYGNDPAYFVVRQLEFAAVGVVFALVLACLDYHTWQGNMLTIVSVITVMLLVIVFAPIAGRDAYGATRWIAIGPFTLQPSEFAKVSVLLAGAKFAESYLWERTLSNKEALVIGVVGVIVPLGLVLLQPDKGTTGVVVMTLIVMCYLAGVRGQVIVSAGCVFAILVFCVSVSDEYSRARIATMFDPANDPFGAGYQLMQGFYAFGTGGLTGLGLGMSRQKYNYLPMAHNDFIYAVIGEEMGLVGTIGLLAAFALLLWSGFKIAEAAPDMAGRLIAAGCTSLFIIQLLLNVGGVLGMLPLTGKPVPFVSYGGSSIISSMMLVGLVTSVSLRSTLPETSYEERRSRMRLTPQDSAATHLERDGSYVGRIQNEGGMPVMSSPLAGSGIKRFRVVEGGRSQKDSTSSTYGVAPYRRLDLGPSPRERLRADEKDLSKRAARRTHE